MKNKLLCIILCALFLVSCVGTVQAQHLTGPAKNVVFTANEKLESDFGGNYSQRVFDAEVRQLQPGDDITFAIHLQNQNEHTVDWYMSNEVLRTLEETREIAVDGGYSYYLEYVGPNASNNRVLFDSDRVGGDYSGTDVTRQGLRPATDALDEFLFLDTLSKGQAGDILLRVGLDGETQGNSYMTTLADVQMNFAVELDSTQPTTPENPTTPTGSNPPTTPSRGGGTPPTVVKTGDNSNLMIYYIIMAISGLLFLILAIDTIRRRRREKGRRGMR